MFILVLVLVLILVAVLVLVVDLNYCARKSENSDAVRNDAVYEAQLQDLISKIERDRQ